MRKRNTKLDLSIYEKGREKVQVINMVIDHIIDDEMSESEACSVEDLDKNWFRRFLRADIEKTVNHGKCYSKLMDWYCWQDVFLHDLVGEYVYAPLGFDAIYDRITKEALTEKEQKVLQLRYQEEYTLEQVSENMNCTKERIRQIQVKAIRKLRYPKYRMPLLYGDEYEKVIMELDTVQKEIDQIYLKREKESKESLLKKIREVQAETRNKEKELDVLRSLKQKTDVNTHSMNEIAEYLKDTPIEVLNLSVRSYNALKRNWTEGKLDPINTVGKLVCLTRKDLSDIRNLGVHSVDEIIDRIRDLYGIEIRNS